MVFKDVSIQPSQLNGMFTTIGINHTKCTRDVQIFSLIVQKVKLCKELDTPQHVNLAGEECQETLARGAES